MYRRMDEAIVWVIKYFRPDSDAKGFFVLFIKGIIDSKLISSPIHIPTQVYDEIVMIVPKIKVIKNRILYKLVNKKKRIKTFIYGV